VTRCLCQGYLDTRVATQLDEVASGIPWVVVPILDLVRLELLVMLVPSSSALLRVMLRARRPRSVDLLDLLDSSLRTSFESSLLPVPRMVRVDPPFTGEELALQRCRDATSSCLLRRFELLHLLCWSSVVEERLYPQVGSDIHITRRQDR